MPVLTFFPIHFIHQLARVSAFLTRRIPEICDVSIEDVRQLDDSEEESARLAID